MVDKSIMELKTIYCNKNIKLVTVIVAVVSIVIPIVGSIVNCPIDFDSAYYLSIMERVSEGSVLYRDVSCGYTPLYIYLLALLKCLFRIPADSYYFFLIVHYCFQIGIAIVLYKILREILREDNSRSFFCAWLYMLMSHWCWGNCVLLDIPSVFFGMLSLYLTWKYLKRKSINYIWVGAVSSCAFLCKQFGAGFFLLSVAIILMSSNSILKKSVYFVTGYAAIVLVCFLYWGKDFIPLINSGYGTVSAESSGYDVSVISKLQSVLRNALVFFTRVCPIVLFSLFAVVPVCRGKDRTTQGVFLISWLGIIGFLGQFLFAYTGLHYFQYLIPFGIIIMCVCNMQEYRIKCMKYLILFVSLITVALSVRSTYLNRVYKIYVQSDKPKKEIILKEEIDRLIPVKSLVWIPGPYQVYYTNKVLPPNMNSIGYSYGTLGLNEEEAWKQVYSSDFVLRWSEDFPELVFFTQEMQDYLEQFPSTALLDSTVVLYDMRSQRKKSTLIKSYD